MSHLLSFYQKSPVVLQNLALGAYGYLLQKRRYSGRYPDTLKAISKLEWADPATLKQYQELCLQQLLQEAFTSVPFYRDMALQQKLDPRDINLSNLHQALPITEKEAVRDNPKRFINEKISKNQQIVINTSGTTGSPMDIITNKDALQQNYAFFSRFLHAAGVSHKDRSITFAGRLILSPTQSQPPYWRNNWAAKTWLFSSYHLSNETIPAYIAKMEKIQPRFIDSYPSAIAVISKFIVENNVDHSIRPQAIITSSETLYDNQRALIENAFQTKVFDQYGSAELAVFAGQCDKGSYHINSEFGHLEVVDEYNNLLPPGQSGEFICTGFINKAMPLIRYRIGDSGSFSPTPCNCGRKHPVIKELLGRTDDIIKTPEGNYVGRLDPLFKGLNGIAEAQIIQKTLSSVKVLIVPGKDYTEASKTKLAEALAIRLGASMHIDIATVATIPRTSNGKFRSVVSEI